MAPPIAVLMVSFTFISFMAAAWAVTSVLPRRLEARTHRQIALHREAVAALDIAMTRADNDAGQMSRLAANRAWHASALETLAPGSSVRAAEATALPKAA